MNDIGEWNAQMLATTLEEFIKILEARIEDRKHFTLLHQDGKQALLKILYQAAKDHKAINAQSRK